MFVDMPPGTGDVPLTVFQSIPCRWYHSCYFAARSCNDDSKAVKMAKLMNISVMGLVENMSYIKLSLDCNKEFKIFLAIVRLNK